MHIIQLFEYMAILQKQDLLNKKVRVRTFVLVYMRLKISSDK